jgi:hypothetical protein
MAFMKNGPRPVQRVAYVSGAQSPSGAVAMTSERRGFVDFTEACYSWLQKKTTS